MLARCGEEKRGRRRRGGEIIAACQKIKETQAAARESECGKLKWVNVRKTNTKINESFHFLWMSWVEEERKELEWQVKGRAEGRMEEKG